MEEIKYNIHVTTKNMSFVKMVAILKQEKVENNKFFLALFDESL